MANTKTQKPSIQGKVGCYNIAFNGKRFILLQGKKQVGQKSFKNKENAQAYAGNLVLIQEKETQINNLVFKKNVLKDRKLHAQRKKYQEEILGLEIKNEALD